MVSALRLRTMAPVLLGIASLSVTGLAAGLPTGTTLPVQFTRAVHAGQAKAGDAVTAKTTQVVLLPDGSSLPKGTLLLGQVVDATPYRFNATPYAIQQASTLSIRFNRLAKGNATVPVHVTVRALADYFTTLDAERPHELDESDNKGTMLLVGGGHYAPYEQQMRDGEDDETIAYNRKQGVFARLLPASGNSAAPCAGTQTEQAVGIFSPGACGLYGFRSTSLTTDAATGVFSLGSTHRAVAIDAGDAALLQVSEGE